MARIIGSGESRDAGFGKSRASRKAAARLKELQSAKYPGVSSRSAKIQPKPKWQPVKHGAPTRSMPTPRPKSKPKAMPEPKVGLGGKRAVAVGAIAAGTALGAGGAFAARRKQANHGMRNGGVR